MTLAVRVLRWLYLFAALLAARCAGNSLRDDAWWYGAGLFAVSLLLVTASARERAAAAERRAATVRAERIARLRARRDDVCLGWADLANSCCLRIWESHGAQHDPKHCTRRDQTA